jgi:phosphoglycerate dehydrogenase-like enzyme
MNTLLIIDTEPAAYEADLKRESLPEMEIHAAQSPDEALETAPGANIILGQPPMVAPILARLDRLQWVQSTFAGVEPLCVSGLRSDYVLTGVKNVFGPLMSEYVLGHILFRERHLAETMRNQAQKKWHLFTYRPLTRLTMGIVGLGSIGRHVAATAHHFGMRVLGMKRTRGKMDHVERVFLPHERNDFLSRLDYLVSILPDTPQTRSFFTLEDFQRMKSSAVFINVGRGTVIDQSVLINALEENYIGGAILDVFKNEPLPPENPLWQMPQVTITPHNAALSLPDKVMEIFSDNYQRFIEHQPLKYVIDIERGY